MESSRSNTTTRTLLIILTVGLILRVTLIVANQRPPVSDEREYDQLAVSLSNEGTYALDGIPTAYRPVGYPLFLAVTYSIAGHHTLVPKFLQALLDTLTAYLLFLIGKAHSRFTGLLASALWGFFVPAILFTNLLLTETLTVFLLTLSLLILFSSEGRPSFWYPALFGLVAGAMTHVKPSLLLFALLLLILSKKLAVPRRHAAVSFIVILAVLLPWMIRNVVILDTFSLSTNGGMNLYVGNNAGSTGAYRGTFPPELADPSTGEVARDRLATGIAKEYILAQPGTFLTNGLKKIVHFFRSEGDLLIASFASHNEDGFIAQYRSVHPIIAALTNFSSFWMLFLGMTGFIAAHRDRRFWITTIFLTSILGVHFLFFGGSRFHFVLMPFATLYASESILALREKNLTFTQARKALVLLCVIFLTSVWSYELFIVYFAD